MSDDPKPLTDEERARLLGELPQFTKEGRCTHPVETRPATFAGFIADLIGPMPKLCGEPATEPEIIGRRMCAKHAAEVRKNTREGKNASGILAGRHRSH